MDDKLTHIPFEDKQNLPFCRCKLLLTYLLIYIDVNYGLKNLNFGGLSNFHSNVLSLFCKRRQCILYNTTQYNVYLSVCLKLKISVTKEPIGLFSSGNIPTGPGIVLSYFIGGWDTPNPTSPKKRKIPPKNTHFFYFFFLNLKNTKIG